MCRQSDEGERTCPVRNESGWTRSVTPRTDCTRPQRFSRFLGQPEPITCERGRGRVVEVPGTEAVAIGVVPPREARRVLGRVFDEDEFLSPHGLRGLSRYHLEHPLSVELAGSTVTVDYEPAESTTGMFGGNSNWRGPVWMPVNYLVLRNLQRYARSLGAGAEVEYPTRSGHTQGLADCAEDLRRRLISLFCRPDPFAGDQRPWGL